MKNLTGLATVAVMAASMAAVAVPNLASAQATPAIAVTYEVIDLGSLGPGYFSRATKINDRGSVVGVLGNVLDPSNCNPPCSYPWGNPAIFRKGRAPRALNDLNAIPTGINVNGDVIGAIGVSSPTGTSFHWKGGITTLIPNVQLQAINDASTAVGSSGSTAVKFENGSVVPLGTWGADVASASAITDVGTIFGFRSFNQIPLTEGVRALPDGTVQSLSPPLPSARSTYPTAANANGDVVGRISLDGSYPYFGFAIFGGQYQKIEWIGSGFTGPLAVNDLGNVVGFYETPSFEDRAFLWSKGMIIDLASLPEVVAAGWTHLVVANDINNRGEIVGWGVRSDGESHAYMLRPRRR
jgi:probable HAF family extracellular repeat protein